jgi:hypothetical protein
VVTPDFGIHARETRYLSPRDAMNRIQNRKEGGIGSIYDRHSYADENKRIMEAVAQHLVSLAEGGRANSKVVHISTRTSG